MVGEMNYTSSIPLEQILSIQKTIEMFRAKYKDGYIGRALIDQRPGVARTVRKDIVRKIDKPKPQDSISTAKISLGGTSPDLVTTKGKDVLHSIYRIDAAIQRNEAELSLDPSLWNRDTTVAMMECLRRENYTIINGDATFGIVGLVGASALNTRGSITAGTNAGSWDGAETNAVMEPYDDIRKALEYLDPNLIGELRLAGRPAYLNYLLQEDDLGKVFADKIGTRLMGKPPGDFSWMIKSDYFPANYVYLIQKSAEAAELLIPEDYNVDANYPREKGQNVYAEIGGWLGIEIHNPDFIVPIAIN
jgi:hypothetical protein